MSEEQSSSERKGVIHVPDGGTSNPYQRNLSAALRNRGLDAVAVDVTGPVVFLLLREVFSREVEVIHLHWLESFYWGENWYETLIKSVAFLVEVCLLRLLGYTLVWTVHNTVPHEAGFESAHRWYRGIVTVGLDRIVVHCETAVTEVTDAFGLDDSSADKIDVVPHGNYCRNYADPIPSTKARARLEVDRSDRMFLFFGSIRPYKGVETLIESFEAAELPDSELLIAGSPVNDAYQSHLESVASGCDSVTLDFGFVPEEDVHRYFSAADVAVFPYRRVLTSGSSILALSFGCPVLLPDVGCNRELVGEDAGVFYRPDEGLSAALKRAAGSDLDRMGSAAVKRTGELSWDGVAEKTAAVYRQAD